VLQHFFACVLFSNVFFFNGRYENVACPLVKKSKNKIKTEVWQQARRGRGRHKNRFQVKCISSSPYAQRLLCGWKKISTFMLCAHKAAKISSRVSSSSSIDIYLVWFIVWLGCILLFAATPLQSVSVSLHNEKVSFSRISIVWLWLLQVYNDLGFDAYLFKWSLKISTVKL
jgi:hypothetical protein